MPKHEEWTPITLNHVNRLVWFELRANKKLFIQLFGEQLGTHLHNKFTTTCHCNLLHLVCQIQSQHVETILNHINENYN
ncbi:MAG: hypothetical protein H6658_12315 [Ardenticatenaceae bacterium]|nr:hypothetical protein [Ardenticatenaceae bacterium]